MKAQALILHTSTAGTLVVSKFHGEDSDLELIKSAARPIVLN